MSLFSHGDFISHSGLPLKDKIECDALTGEDWYAVGRWFADRLNFRKVIGVPRGGLRLAMALHPYADDSSQFVLIVDDVLTTGRSMYEMKHKFTDIPEEDIIGAVLFARTPIIPRWIIPRFIEQP